MMTTEDSMQYDESYGAYEEGYDEGAYYQEGGQEAASAAGMKFHTAPSALVEDSHLAALASFCPSPVNGLSTNCGLIRCTPRMVKYPVTEGNGIRRTFFARCYKYSHRLHLFPKVTKTSCLRQAPWRLKLLLAGKSKCQFCKKDFHPQSLSRHIARTHTEQEMLECEYCGKRYKGDANLKEHMRIVHQVYQNKFLQ